MIIHDPTVDEYNKDLNVLALNDRSYRIFNEMYMNQIRTARPLTVNSGLINMANTWANSDGDTVGQMFKTESAPGQKSRVRLVDAAMHAHFRFSINKS
ncbi:hypothetical protein BDV26DRAFT_276359 [Aspergillus bertholletiae]|uniref:Plastocyanin-like domain-containing protein n=1 Tax=Aspergillus bertholletiae TaxID=1226010 RepID=A0A5N7ANM1_9EURO|nr:hypothetical protein BDV26DRAFT_276359 [Aspergillus bertholletiae]